MMIPRLSVGVSHFYVSVHLSHVRLSIGIKERGQPATSPIVEELNLGHVETGALEPVTTQIVKLNPFRLLLGWCIRYGIVKRIGTGH